MSVFRFTNLTKNLEIGANSYLLEINGHNLVLDCGAHPKQEGLSQAHFIFIFYFNYFVALRYDLTGLIHLY